MQSAKAEAYFRDQFQKDLQKVGSQVLDRYRPVVNAYKDIIIPFERKRVNQHQSIIFENSSLEQNKLQLMGKVEKYRSESQKLQNALEMQRKKLMDYERRIEEQQTTISNNLSVIQSLRLRNDDYQQALKMKNSAIVQLQKDKTLLLEKFQDKDKEYNIVLANCMRDKNDLAEKLNHLNQLEISLHQKQKEIKAEQFYIQKQWEQFQEMKKQKQTQKQQPKATRSHIFGMEKKEVTFDNPYGKEEEQKQKKGDKNINYEILRQPLKKLVKHHQSEIYDFAFNYNGNLLASCGGDRTIKVQDINSMRTVSTVNSNSAQSIYISVGLDYGGQRLLAGSTDKSVSIFSASTGKHMHSFLGHGSKVNSVSWTSSREKCVSGSDDKQMKVWDIEKASNVFSVSCGKGVKIVKTNHIQPMVYTGHTDGSVRIYSLSQGNAPVSQVKGIIDYAISSLTLLSSNRHQVLVSSYEGSVLHLFDLKMNKSVCKYQHKDFFNSSTHATMSPSQSFVLAGNCDGMIYYWNKFKGDVVKRVTAHDGPTTALTYQFMSSVLATGDKEGNIILWQ